MLEAVKEIYTPQYFSRTGLRYIDVITRSELGLNNVDWNLLLKPFILGIISDPVVGGNVKEYEGKYEIRLEDKKGIVRMITKLTSAESDDESCFIIDSDFF